MESSKFLGLMFLVLFLFSCKEKFAKEDIALVCSSVGYKLVTGYILDSSLGHLVMGPNHKKIISETKSTLGENPSVTMVQHSSKAGYEMISRYMPKMVSSCMAFVNKARKICNIPNEKNTANVNRLVKIYQQSLSTSIVNYRVGRRDQKVDITQFSAQQMEDSLVKNRTRIKECGGL